MKFNSFSHLVMVLWLLVNFGGPQADWRWASVDNISISVDTPVDLISPEYLICSDAPQDCSLRGAISHTNANPGNVYDIHLPGYVIGLYLQGGKEDGNQTGDLDIYGSINLIGDGTTIDGNQIDRVLHIHPGASVSIRGVTITGGKTPDVASGGGSADPGGGVYNAGNLYLGDSLIFMNTTGRGDNESSGTGGDGGGLYNTGVTTIEKSNISGNTTGSGGWDNEWYSLAEPGGSGGGIYNLGSMVLIQTSVIGNLVATTSCNLPPGGCAGLGYAGGASGGGIFNAGSLSISQGVVGQNAAAYPGGGGGGLYSTGILEMKETDISQNGASDDGAYSGNGGGNGGGLYLAAGSESSISDSTIWGNHTGDGTLWCSR